MADKAAKRVDFTHDQNLLFLDLWEEFYPLLHLNRRNGPLYYEMAKRLRDSGIENVTRKTVTQKIDNMQRKFRSEKMGTRIMDTSPSLWPYYGKVAKILMPSDLYDDNSASDVGLRISSAVPDTSVEGESRTVISPLGVDQQIEEGNEMYDEILSEDSAQTKPRRKKRKRSDDALKDLVSQGNTFLKESTRIDEEIKDIMKSHVDEMKKQTALQEKLISLLSDLLSKES